MPLLHPLKELLFGPAFDRDDAIKIASTWRVDDGAPGIDLSGLQTAFEKNFEYFVGLVRLQETRSSQQFAIASSLLAVLLTGITTDRISVWYSSPALVCLILSLLFGLRSFYPLKTVHSPHIHYLVAKYRTHDQLTRKLVEQICVEIVIQRILLQWKSRLVACQTLGVILALMTAMCTIIPIYFKHFNGV